MLQSWLGIRHGKSSSRLSTLLHTSA
uniref:Uncharacterized protein n=1 Tax=Physcomitrium patens TaxID=3218 RepID=A0A2K1J6R0_PHYPA|nr:hypothetical protein PHYPA_020313 [Physcomitrium patens]